MAVGTWLRKALRVWRRRPILSIGVVLTLGGAIALGVAMTTVVDAVARRASIFPNADDVVVMHDPSPEPGAHGETIPITAYAEWRATSVHFQEFAAYQIAEVPASADSRTEVVRAVRFSGTLFDVLGVTPIAGRLPGRGDEQAQPCSAVLTRRFATALFGGAPQAIQQNLILEKTVCSVAGVIDDRYAFPSPETMVFTVVAPRADVVRQPDGRVSVSIPQVRVIGTPKTGVARDQLRAEAAQYFSHDAVVNTLRASMAVSYRRTLELLRVSSFAVLAVAVLNVAALLAAAAVERVREWAVKGVLGASPRDLWRESFFESAVLCLPATALGLAVAYGIVRFLTAHGPTELMDATISLWTVTLWLAVSVGLTVTASLPAWWQASRSRVVEGTAIGTAGATAGGATVLARRLMPAIVVVQVCTSMVLVAVSLTFATSVYTTLTRDRGFSADDVAVIPTFRLVSTPVDAYLGELTAIQRTLAEGPGAVASLAVDLPVPHISRAVSFAGDQESRGTLVFRDGQPYRLALVGAQYFELMRTPILVGRDFTSQDSISTPPVAIVSRTFAQRQFGGMTNALGQTWDIGRLLTGSATIVGVAADVTRSVWDYNDIPTVYVSIGQLAGAAEASQPALERTILIVRGLPLARVHEAIRQHASGMNTGTAWTVWDARMQEVAVTFIYLAAAGAFAVVTLLLITIGVFAVTAEQVHRRRPELAVRQAVGASPLRAACSVGVFILRWWALATVLGAGLGAYVSSVAMSSDESTARILGVAVVSVCVVTGTMLAALVVPARRALSIQPARLLRTD
jgi:predicted permease